MSNKEFSSVEWLYHKMVIKLCNKLQTIEYTHLFLEELEQAKAMCITEHENTWNNAINAVEKDKWDSFEEYYNETFRGEQ